MKQNFKKGLAVVLTILTALCVVANYAERLNAMDGWEKALGVITLASISAVIALPLWLTIITMWHKLHNRSYRAFKNWCIFQANELTRA